MHERLPERSATVAIEDIGKRFSRYRVMLAGAVEVMRGSLERYGQLSPVVVFEREGKLELIDGFKRLEAAPRVAGLLTLRARIIEADEQSAKAAIYLLNRVGGRTRDLEEGWIVQSLVREDGLSQQEVAELLGKHKSWVSRRLALVERLSPKAFEDLQLGFLTPTGARDILRLPCGNQEEVLDVVRREAFSTSETHALVDAFLGCANRSQREYVLEKPREAIAQGEGSGQVSYDPRLSPAANRIRKRLHYLLDALPRMEGWLRLEGCAELTAEDLSVLEPAVGKLAIEARSVAEAAEDFCRVAQR